MDWVWSMWGWIWPAAFNADKFKVDLKTGIIRTNLHKLKLQEQLQRDKGEILDVIRSGRTEIARIKVESLIQDYRKISAYDIIVHYCESMLSRMELLQVTGDTPSEILSAIHTLAYASSNLTIPELNNITTQLKAKYGYKIGDAQVESAAVWIDKKVIEALSVAPPSEEEINKYMQQFYGKAESSEVGFPVSLTKGNPTPHSPRGTPEPLYYPPSTPQYSPYSPSFPYTPVDSSPAQTPPILSPSPSAPMFSPPPPAPLSTQSLYPNLGTPTHSGFPVNTPSPSPSRSSSYIDPNLLYSSPCTTYDASPFVSPPPENPEFTAHEASRAHVLKMANEAARKRTSETSPTKEYAHGGIRKKKRVPKIKKHRNNPFQRGAAASVKQEGEHQQEYSSSDEEDMDTTLFNAEVKKEGRKSTSESEESDDLSARLEALKRNK